MSNQPACRIRAPFEYVGQSGLSAAADAHMVGHEVQDLAEPAAANAADMSR